MEYTIFTKKYIVITAVQQTWNFVFHVNFCTKFSGVCDNFQFLRLYEVVNSLGHYK